MMALDRPQLDKLLDEAAADYGLDLATPQGLTAALLAVNTRCQIENNRILLALQQAIG